jgi:hypothetical protein
MVPPSTTWTVAAGQFIRARTARSMKNYISDRAAIGDVVTEALHLKRQDSAKGGLAALTAIDPG